MVQAPVLLPPPEGQTPQLAKALNLAISHGLVALWLIVLIYT